MDSAKSSIVSDTNLPSLSASSLMSSGASVGSERGTKPATKSGAAAAEDDMTAEDVSVKREVKTALWGDEEEDPYVSCVTRALKQNARGAEHCVCDCVCMCLCRWL